MRAALYSARWVLPVTQPPIRDGAVLVDEQGIIIRVGTLDSMQTGDDVARIELGDAILLPGLVNVHTHPELTGMRGLLEDLPFHRWIPALRHAKEAAALSAADFGLAARWACIEALAAGVTTLGATEDSGAALDALREAGMRGTVYREVFGPAPQQAGAALAQLRGRVDEMRAAQTDLVRVGVSPHAPYTVSDDLFSLTAAYAAAEQLPIAVHAAESEAEELLVLHGEGPFAAGLRTRGIATPPRATSTIALLERTGVLALQPLLIHCVRLVADDVQRIADAGAAVAHCPVANARIGNGIAPLVELAEAGIAIGLGSDSVASNNRIDMLEEARTAQLMQRARLTSGGALPPERLLRMLTIDGAGVLGCADRTGSLEPGKDADLCAVDISAPHNRPISDVLATLLLSARGSDVTLTAVRGAVLYRDGRHLTLQPEVLRADLDALGERLHAARSAGAA